VSFGIVGRMKLLWNYKDIFDLEYFLHKDSTVPTESLSQRDRAVFLQQIEPSLHQSPKGQERLFILHTWLEHRRKTEFGATDSLSPGALFAEAHRTLRLICLVIGLFFGSIAGLTFFNYAGTTPVNIFSFFVFFILTQIAILLLLIISFVLRYLLRGKIVSLPLGIRIMGGLTTKTILWGHRNILGRMWAESRDSLAASLGLLKGNQRIYGALFFWPIFVLTQLLAIGANAGVLAATLFRILTSDVAFGWQSTVQFSGQTLFAFVQLISLPWSWFIPGDFAHPSLTAIEGSRIILKDGISHLATRDLVSWWPFLILCLLVYGLLPRVVLYFLAIYMQYRSLMELRFQHAPCNRLLQRMQTPQVSTQAAPEFEQLQEKLRSDHPSAADSDPAAKQPSLTPVLVLIPDDIYPLDEERIQHLLENRGFAIAEQIRFMENYDTDRELLETLVERDWSKTEGIIILMESWMPPLVAFLSFLGEIRRAIGPDIPIAVELLGKPAADAIPATVSTVDRAIWAKKITALGDPCLSLEPLRETPGRNNTNPFKASNTEDQDDGT